MNEPEVMQLDIHELKKRIDQDPKLCLIDVREQDEWNTGHIPGATHIPKDCLLEKIALAVPDKNQAIFLYCHGGTRSTLAAGWLHHVGYKEVYSVAGGIHSWESSGFPLII